MTNRGLSSRTRLLRWGLFVAAVTIVLAATVPAAWNAIIDIAALDPGKLPWVATRLVGFLAYFAIAGSVVYGLLLSTKILDSIAHRPVSFALHQDLAAIGLGLAGIHAVLLGLDSTVPFSLGEMLVPFSAPYRPLWVGVGQLALYVTAIVEASFYVRRRIGTRAWRTLHYITFLAFAGATVHGIMAGSDSGSTWAWWIYVVAAATVIFLTVYRIVSAAVPDLAGGRQPAVPPFARPPTREPSPATSRLRPAGD
jgi:sulfoxide reductase heme-binding subunit YedZ